MKTLSTLLILAISAITYAQSGTVRLYLHLKYEDETPYANNRVFIKNAVDATIDELRTDTQGKIKYRVAVDATYELQLKKDQTFQTIKIPKKGRSFITKTFTVNKKEYPSYESDTIYQNINPRTDLPSAAYGVAEIFIGDRNQKPVRDLEVRLFDKKTGKTYITKTTNSGNAYFKVPNNTTYDVGIETLNRYKTIKVPNKPDVYVRTGFPFVPTNISETLENDTIRQDLPEKALATSTRALVHILVNNYDGEPLPNEQIALNPRNDSLTYLGQTNENGVVEFLLPVGLQYVLHFYYERNIDLLDFRVKGGLHKTNIQYTYMGSEALREYYNSAGRDANGFLAEFMEIPIEPLDFNGKDYLEYTDVGYNIDFKEDKGIINAPTVINGKIYAGSGYYSRKVYVFDEKTGKYLWGIQLSEGGPSSLVYENGILLVITESCTLYAIDAETGKLLWSKYLAPFMYSTPSVANGKVIATYPSGLEQDESFVLGCFDLKTGKIDWQKPIDAEAIAAPVLYKDKIYTATRAGRLYQHNLKDGKRLQMDSLAVVTPPTIVDNSIYIGALKDKNKQHLLKLNADNFQQKTILNSLSSSFKGRPKNAALTMCFDGIRPFHKAGKNYLVSNSQLICSETNGEINWQSQLNGLMTKTSPYNIMPIAFDNTVVAVKNNHIQLFNAKNGELIKDYEVQGDILTQPTIQNGLIYSGSKERKLMVVNTEDKTLTGWNMWNGDGSHNAAIED